MKLILFLIISSFFFTQYIYCQDLRKPEPNDDIEKIIIQELANINGFYKTDISVWLSNTQRFNADENKGIIFNKTILSNYKSTSNLSNYSTAIRLIMAHENIHLKQYSLYGIDQVKNSDIDIRRIYECQADILAGKYAQELRARQVLEKIAIAFHDRVPMEKLDSVLQLEKTFNNDALQLFYDVGNQEIDPSTHPFKEHRLLAIKFGLVSGLIYTLKTALIEFKNTLTEYDIATISNAMVNLRNITGLSEDSENNLMIWSYNYAKRITHYHTAAYRNVVVSYSEPKWNVTQDHPYVHFSYELYNSGEKEILCDFQLRCETVLRNNPNATKYSQFLTSKNYIVKLKPKSLYNVTDSLLWQYNQKEFMPRLIHLTSPLAFFSCEYVDGNYNITTTKIKDTNNAFFDEKITSRSLPTVVLQIVISRNYKDLASICGDKYWFKNEQDYDFITYKCFNPFSNVTLYIPKATNEKEYVEIDMYDGDSKTEATLVYMEALNKLKTFFEFHDETNTTVSKSTTFTHKDTQGKIIYISYRKSRISGNYQVTVTIN